MITALASVLSIGLHFTALLFTTKFLAQFHGAHPTSIVFSLLPAVIAHLLEVLIFAIALQYMLSHDMIAKFYKASVSFGFGFLRRSTSAFLGVVLTLLTTIRVGDAETEYFNRKMSIHDLIRASLS